MWERYPEIKLELDRVEEYIRKSISSKNRLLGETALGLVLAGGKRLRPALTVISSKFGSYDGGKVISVAAALEVLHTATLVHDDIIDRSKLRRGRITVSESHGVDMAVYTGDFLFTKAVLMLSRDISVERLDTVARALKAICEGEVDQYEDRFNFDVSILSYLKRINRKTAVMFGAACGLGAYVAECPEELSRDLARFGLMLGMAFQIRDDLNDFLSTTGKSGKPVCDDLKKGIVTLPVIYAMRKSPALKELLSGLAGGGTGISARDIAAVNDMVKDSGGIGRAAGMLDRYIEKGTLIAGRLPDNAYSRVLKELILGLKI